MAVYLCVSHSSSCHDAEDALQVSLFPDCCDDCLLTTSKAEQQLLFADCSACHAADSNAYMATADHDAPLSDKDMTVKSLRRTLWPLLALLAATGGVGLLLRLLRR